MTFPNTLLVAATLTLSIGALTPSARATDRKVPSQFPTIQAAVDVSATGDRILVSRAKAGPYAENVTVTVKDLVILGKRAEINAMAAGPAFSVDAVGVTISGFIIRNAVGGAINIQGDNATVSRVDIAGCEGNGISVTGNAANIERNQIKFVGGSGIVVSATANLGTTRIERNVVCLNADSGIVSGGADVRMERNVIEYNQDDGIQVNDGGFGGSQGTSINNNRIRCNGGNGVCIFETSSAGLGLLANTIENNGRNGISVITGSGVSAEKNKIRKNSENGVASSGTSTTLKTNRIENNTLNGVYLDNGLGDGGHKASDNTVRGNGRDGIVLLGGMNMLNGNTCERNLGDGIDVEAVSAGDSAGNSLVGNRCNRNGHEGIDNSGFGTTVKANKCAKNGPAGQGIDIAGSGNKADSGDAIGIGTVVDYTNNKTGDDSQNDGTLAQVLDI